MKFFSTFEEVLLGDDNKASIKRIMASVSFITYIFLCIEYVDSHTEFIIGSLVTMVLSLIGVITYANLNPPPIQNMQNEDFTKNKFGNIK